MNKSIIRFARKFIKIDLKYQLNFEAVEKYLNAIGYIVLFYDEHENLEMLTKYNLVEYSKQCDGFTLNDGEIKIVFIRKSLSSHDMLYTILHETGHIVLKHLDCNRTVANKHIQEIEADTFVYSVLNAPKNKTAFALLLSCIIAFIIFGVTNIKNNSNEETTSQTFNSTYTDVSSSDTQNKSEIVYVTPSGSKYHRSDCRYVKNKNCTSLTRAEATQKYAPCSVCEP